MIKYKWETYAYRNHYIGAFAHFVYIFTVSMYIYHTFLEGEFGELTVHDHDPDHDDFDYKYPAFMAVGIAYPFIYESI